MHILTWSITPAVCTGISACFFLLLILKMFEQVTVENKMSHEARKRLPFIFVLALPFAGNFRFIARHPSMKTWQRPD